MTAYRIYGLSKFGRIVSASDVECPGDAQAIAEAERRAGGLAEVWHSKRFVGWVDGGTRGRWSEIRPAPAEARRHLLARAG